MRLRGRESYHDAFREVVTSADATIESTVSMSGMSHDKDHGLQLNPRARLCVSFAVVGIDADNLATRGATKEHRRPAKGGKVHTCR